MVWSLLFLFLISISLFVIVISLFDIIDGKKNTIFNPFSAIVHKNSIYPNISNSILNKTTVRLKNAKPMFSQNWFDSLNNRIEIGITTVVKKKISCIHRNNWHFYL